MSAYPGGRALPAAALTLLAVAVGLLWIGLLLGLLAAAWASVTTGLWLFSPFAAFAHLDGPMWFAIAVQMLVQMSVLFAIWALGSGVLWLHLRGAPERAADLAIWLVRVLIVLAVLQLLAAGAVGYAGAESLFVGAMTALPVLPNTLVAIAFLICAEAYLRRAPDDVF